MVQNSKARNKVGIACFNKYFFDDDDVTIYGPMIYTAPPIRILMRADG